MNLNKVILIGRISQQPTSFQSKSGVSVTRFSLAISRDFQKNSEITDFIPLVAFDNTANFINRFFNKGDLVTVVGSLQSSQYTSKSGDLITSISVLIDQIKSLEPKSVTQARVEKGNLDTPLDEEQSAPTFYAEEKEKNTTKKSDEDENPWELDF